MAAALLNFLFLRCEKYGKTPRNRVTDGRHILRILAHISLPKYNSLLSTKERCGQTVRNIIDYSKALFSCTVEKSFIKSNGVTQGPGFINRKVWVEVPEGKTITQPRIGHDSHSSNESRVIRVDESRYVAVWLLVPSLPAGKSSMNPGSEGTLLSVQ